MKILFLSAWFPYPLINGAKIRIFNLIRELARSHEISLYAFCQTVPIDDARCQIQSLEDYCDEVVAFPVRRYNSHSLKGLFSIHPRSVFQMLSPEFAHSVKHAIATHDFDIVIASEVGPPGVVSWVASQFKYPPVILDALEIAVIKEAFYLEKSLLTRLRSALTWFKLRAFTRKVLKRVVAVTVPSQQELINLKALLPQDSIIESIPHCLNYPDYCKEEYGEPILDTIVFTGSFTYSANFDAVQYFLKDIFPDLKLRYPSAVLRVIGNTAGYSLEKLSANGDVIFTGLLKDVRSAISKSWLSIVPLRFGAGTRLKIIESMALGTPVVSTSKGAEGLDVCDGKNILIADTPKAFTEAVLSVLCNADLRQSLSVEGRKLVSEKYDSAVIGQKFDSLFERIFCTS